jgi:hypothetical protein
VRAIGAATTDPRSGPVPICSMNWHATINRWPICWLPTCEPSNGWTISPHSVACAAQASECHESCSRPPAIHQSGRLCHRGSRAHEPLTRMRAFSRAPATAALTARLRKRRGFVRWRHTASNAFSVGTTGTRPLRRVHGTWLALAGTRGVTPGLATMNCPQLFNVLGGEMSLVGPPPIVRAEVTRSGRDRTLLCREARPHGTVAGQRAQRHVLHAPRAA